MHEYSVTKALIDLCNQEAEKNKLSKVKKINLKIGKFTGFSPDSIRFYFSYLGPETKCADAEIKFEEIPIRVRCQGCREESIIEEPIFLCPHCGKADIEVISGREFYVESIEGE